MNTPGAAGKEIIRKKVRDFVSCSPKAPAGADTLRYPALTTAGSTDATATGVRGAGPAP